MQQAVSTAFAWLKNAWADKTGADQQALIQAYRRLAASRDGQRVLADLARYCNVLNSSYTPGDQGQTLFNEGQRDVYLHMLSMAQLSDEAMQALQQGR